MCWTFQQTSAHYSAETHSTLCLHSLGFNDLNAHELILPHAISAHLRVTTSHVMVSSRHMTVTASVPKQVPLVLLSLAACQKLPQFFFQQMV